MFSDGVFRVIGVHPESDSEWKEGPEFNNYSDANLYSMGCDIGDGFAQFHVCFSEGNYWIECYQDFRTGKIIRGERIFKFEE